MTSMGASVKRWRSIIGGLAIGGMAIAGPSNVPWGSDTDELTLTAISGSAHGHDHQPFSFTIEGKSVHGLYPGAVRNIELTLSNPYNVRIKVLTLRGEIVGSSKRACRPGVSTLAVRPYTGTLPLTIPAHTRKKAGSVPIFMPRNASASCEKTTFTVRLLGTATKVNR
jgi:hypothetical protein